MRPFGCPVTILDTLDPLGKFDGKDEEGFLVGTAMEQTNKNAGPQEANGDTDDPLMPDLEDTDEVQNTGIFGSAFDDENLDTYNSPFADQVMDAEADFNNMEPSTVVSPIPTTRVHSIHLKDQIIVDPKSAIQTRGMSKKSSEEHAMISYIQKQRRTNHKDFQNCLFACFLSQQEPTKIAQAPDDESWVEAMQEELLQFKIQNEAKRVISVLAYASFRNCRLCIQMDVKIAFSYVLLKRRSNDRVIECNLTSSYKILCSPFVYAQDFKFNQKFPHLNAVKRIFRYLKGRPNLGLWYPKGSSFILEAFSDSDYAGASLDRKSKTGRFCQFLGSRLISWQCKKQTVVANSTTEAEYIAASHCCGQNPVYHSKTKHIEIRHHFIRDSYEKRLIEMVKIHTDNNVADLLTKAFDVSRFNFLVQAIGGDSVERAIATVASLDAVQDSDNIIRTQTMAMPNVDIPQGMDICGSPRRQDTIRGAPAHTRSERVLEKPNEPPRFLRRSTCTTSILTP
ncbi:hypothetical protein Tco_0802689 [Tanacetum coccineum]|uniref:Reverse transcriptase Ty1/copia-type domain-containing protein n=1 Tax=Tanacetum coccineum TaxID=301880 RepID=A0ABQ5A2D4_9ASTR